MSQQSNAEPVADIDLAIDKVRLFRLERMNDSAIWIRLYREGGEDKVIWLDSPSAISVIVEDDKAKAALAQSDASAGLIEAAEWHEVKAREIDRWSTQTRPSNSAYDFHTSSAEYFRARAADRSGK